MGKNPSQADGPRFEPYTPYNPADVRILPEDAAREAPPVAAPSRAARSSAPLARPSEPFDDSYTRESPYGHGAYDRYGERPAQPQAPAPAAQRRGPSACAILAGTFALLAVSCILLAYATLRGGADGLGRLTGLLPSINFGIVTTPTVTIDVTRPTVLERVRALSRLETVHYQMEKVVSGKSSGPLPEFLTSDRILLVAHGEVVGGVDLSKLTENSMVVNGKSVTVRLPQAEVFSSSLDNSKTYVYDRQTGIFSKPDPNLESQLRAAAEREIRNAALEDGILTKAQANAEQTLRTLFEGLGFEQVQFEEER